MDTVFIFGAQYLIYFSLGIGGIYFLIQPLDTKKKMLIVGILALLLVTLSGFLANHLYTNPRPFVVGHFTPLIPHIPDNGFPSDHVLLAAAVAAVVFIFSRRVGICLGIIALAIAISRVYVGVHHPIDVTASVIIAILSTWLVYAIYKKLGVSNT